MAQDFSDPLTSAAYASSRTQTRYDPLLAPSSTPAHNEQSTKAKVSSYSLLPDPLSSPTVSPLQTRTTPSASIRRNSPSPAPTRAATTGASPARLSTPPPSSSPRSQPFSDPLLDSRSSDSDYERFKRHGFRKDGDHLNDSPVRPRSAIASFTSPSPQVNVLDSPYNSAPHSPAAPPLATDIANSPKAVSSPLRNSPRESSYDQQRVKAPQFLHITISETDRKGKDGMFVLSAQTNMPRYKRQTYRNITRAYLDFVKLREHLVAEHPEAIVPALPLERSLVTPSDMDTMRHFVERISHHPVLSQDYELQMFIESEFGFQPPAKPKSVLDKLLNIGVKRFSTGGNAVYLGDTDDEFEEEKTVATQADSKLQTMIKCLDKEIKARRDFSSKESELATLGNTLAAAESSPDLAKSFKSLAKPLDEMSKASKAQVGGDATVLGSFLEYKLQHVQTLGSALDYRLSVLGEYDAAIKSTESKRKTMERLRSSASINPDKVTDSIDDLEDAVLFEGNMKKRMEQVTKALTKDLEGYKQQSQEDFMRVLLQYTQRQIGFEKAKLNELVSVGASLRTEYSQEPTGTDENASLSSTLIAPSRYSLR
ncbi:Vps5 C terminal like-domain-containing protein [Mortierella sp. GBAus27b]|nr:Vacuolar protein sorting-associated protein 17 [Mortierella sp. GBA43]KAI8358224.1 Vps5 C terminal like-domain-containing protein [Mortierella sp. GBAus27b]